MRREAYDPREPKDTMFQVRISKQLQEEFEAACEKTDPEAGSVPRKLRSLIADFVASSHPESLIPQAQEDTLGLKLQFQIRAQTALVDTFKKRARDLGHKPTDVARWLMQNYINQAH